MFADKTQHRPTVNITLNEHKQFLVVISDENVTWRNKGIKKYSFVKIYVPNMLRNTGK